MELENFAVEKLRNQSRNCSKISLHNLTKTKKDFSPPKVV
jgi:hypothetical protein